MLIPKVFIASSSEGLPGVVEPAYKLLRDAFEGTAEVSLWTKEFQLNKVYIESLEDLLDASDFAVLVLTPDDRTTSRNREQLSPRDNVVFELGLFFGRLGRERCFILKPTDLDLKLPSDLLGIETAQFSTISESSEIALEGACLRIVEAIRNSKKRLPSRPKLDRAGHAVQAEIRQLGDRIAGTWWEQILFKDAEPALSLVEIALDDKHSSIQLDGKVYDRQGSKLARWRSAAARLQGGTVIYVRQCRRLDEEVRTRQWLPGWAEINFDASEDVITSGDGQFWESDESHPESSLVKLVDMRRCIDERHRAKMKDGTKQERRELVSLVLDSW